MITNASIRPHAPYKSTWRDGFLVCCESDQIEQVIASLPPITSLYESGNTPETLFERLSGGTGVILDKKSVRYHCTCSHDGFLKSLQSLSIDALTPLADEDHGAHITCHFCKKEYHHCFPREKCNNLYI